MNTIKSFCIVSILSLSLTAQGVISEESETTTTKKNFSNINNSKTDQDKNDTISESDMSFDIYNPDNRNNNESEISFRKTTTPCIPPCRTGFICIDGNCVDNCNPPCPKGFKCAPEQSECIPMQSSNHNQQDFSYYPNSPTNISCPENNFFINGKCMTKDEVMKTGLVRFIVSDVFYGLGTMYSAIAPFIIRELCWTTAEYEWEYEREYYDWETAMFSMGPQSALFISMGFFNSGSRGNQEKVLKNLEIKPSYVISGIGKGLHIASIGTSTMNLFMNITEDREAMTIASIASGIVLFSSYFINNAAFISNQNKIRNAVSNKTLSKSSENKISIVPYFAYCKNMGNLGVQLQF